ncbi:hypothetical protein LP420_38025 [Massilia sp. B-10]|nr:hypothetical protein LP420_38025 [Massilia sp. B-10]UUZ54075.1 hypothetical protein LP419_37515 [Massilia sp. H-1]
MVRASLYNIINTELGRPVDASTVGRHGILSSNFLNHASESLILWNGQHMDATSGSTQEQTIIDEMAQRADSLHVLWREVRAGNVGHRQFDASVNAWIANDGAAFREVGEARWRSPEPGFTKRCAVSALCGFADTMRSRTGGSGTPGN